MVREDRTWQILSAQNLPTTIFVFVYGRVKTKIPPARAEGISLFSYSLFENANYIDHANGVGEEVDVVAENNFIYA